MKRKIDNLEKLVKRLRPAQGTGGGAGYGQCKGGGKGKNKKGNNRGGSLVGKLRTHTNGEPLCFNFNLQKGCTMASPGSKCARGWHFCAEPGCGKAHSLFDSHA